MKTPNDLNSIDFLVIGAQKSATSWLYRVLQATRDIQVQHKKRDDDLLFASSTFDIDEFFRRNYPTPTRPGAVRGHVAIEYQLRFDIASRLAEEHIWPRLIFLRREVRQRFVSAAYWKMRTGQISAESIAAVLEKCAARVATTDFDQAYADPYTDLIARCAYRRTITEWRNRGFGHTLEIAYDDVANNPAQVMASIGQFLSVDIDMDKLPIRSLVKPNNYSVALAAFQARLGRSRFLAKSIELLTPRKLIPQPRLREAEAELFDELLSRYESR